MLKGKGATYLVPLVLAIVAPLILTSPFERDHLVLGCIFAILALSLDMVMAGMRQYSFGHTAFFGIGAYASAMLSVKLGALYVWLGILAGTVLGGIAGFVIGYICLRHLRAVTLAIVTYGFAMIFLVITSNWWEVTGGARGILRIPPPSISIPFLPQIVVRSELSYYYLALGFLLLVMYLITRFWHSRTGRAVLSIGGNESLANAVGIDVLKYYTIAFTVSAAVAGLSGALYCHYIGAVNPMLFGAYYVFIMWVMVIIGGSGTLGGPILGSFLFVWLPDVLPVAEEHRLIIFGAILLVAIIFLPRGIYPYLTSAGRRFTNLVGKHLSQR